MNPNYIVWAGMTVGTIVAIRVSWLWLREVIKEGKQ